MMIDQTVDATLRKKETSQLRFETLLLARTCLGLAAGLFTISVPAMIAEGLPKKKAEAGQTLTIFDRKSLILPEML